MHPTASPHLPKDGISSPSSSPHISSHLPLSVGVLGFWDFSTSSMSSSNALETFSSYRALASVQAQPTLSASFLPSSELTCRCSGRRSLLLPVMQMGTLSVPCKRN